MKKKQASVEWLGLELNIIFHDLTPELWEQVEVKFQQAKEMHNREVISFAKKCLDKALDLDVRTAHSQVEEVYNETFGGDND